MAYLISLLELHEVQVDKDGEYINSFEENLPHKKEIQKEICESWNKDSREFLLDFLNKECDEIFNICIMKPVRSNPNKTVCGIYAFAKPGKKLTRKIRDKFYDFIDAQMCDGWGEGFFGPINIMESLDGSRFYVD